MKIKLVTFAPHPNFGTCLQSYALNYVLRKMGHNVEFIYNRRETSPLSFKQYIIKRDKKNNQTFNSRKKKITYKRIYKTKKLSTFTSCT